MQYLYIKSSYQFLQTHFKSEINDFLDTFQTQRIMILIIFLLGFLFAFIFIWSPYINRIARDVQKIDFSIIYNFKLIQIWYTRSLLGIIPLSEIKRIKSINRFIKKYIIEKQL